MKYKQKKNIKQAFTLAEILLALVIIGVAAAICIPPLLNKIQDAQLKVAFKRNYQTLFAAQKLMYSDNGGSMINIFYDPDGAGPNTEGDGFAIRLSRYINVSKICYNNGNELENGVCWPIESDDGWYTRLKLGNGTLMMVGNGYPNCNHGMGAGTLRDCGTFWIDVNGFKKPNKWGRDVFGLTVMKSGSLMPWGINGYYENSCSASAVSNKGFGCAAKVIKGEDYDMGY